ncbi:3-deoxy-manno-octulosonate cytidylyltransferase [Mucilaginibacter rubeus]|uniref:3-deoxy-manno-octulosonate cytidylyltransferase n=1 Tax=Mucilaginibacter rubeus TaxID=2027860 RepID=A0AAE6MIW9_9SPHI|nr:MULTISPECIES: 3-deoxy-manno-octulosonate cytidylyltransferase [Mucilaginibacter]QEM04582.1 3-deoxy-manno-octulosonate cytidylyltransferase [Mucilaginibacter rubeus]QEM17175.1 3-deoxy-manno-octulosonate cytidylyltransferase [Mucilaginibacter gossypii]QTE46320.1 3-deoxy-manno-octulosonate cytidylyltransferase [Mucilaginibacter rubeus]QTE52917.1 3-deoxy-manno-octulosonate cytidylyltransferase [Mucilaginibacter rubeus]QTE58003.1 3-deoxy-manno-octulosonate cytidylyltransferase [Mucilaginibacter 
MKILGIIPARYASSRFPGKPLVDIGGKTMIQRVYEQAKKCRSLSEVIVATDDDRIFNHVNGFGGVAVMTGANHQSGTDRCAEVARLHPGYDVIINIQGDEPFIAPEQITKLTACFNDPETQLATLIKRILTEQELHNTNSPKVVINKLSEAIYFSRATLPHIRGQEPENWLEFHTFFKHIGIYGYRADILQEVTKLPVSPLEKAESLEQLRWIDNGYRIKVAETELETHAVDVPEDLEKLKFDI